VLGMMLGPIGWLITLCSKDERRTCAFCAEPIKDAAKFCPHCGRQQPEQQPKRKPEPPKVGQVQTWANSPKFGKSDAWLLFSIVVAVILMLGYAFMFKATPESPVKTENTWTPRTAQEAYAAHLDEMAKKAGINQ
jgi:hypothetical protein